MRELVARGLVTSDQFFALRRLSRNTGTPRRGYLGLRHMQFPPGRFALVRFPDTIDESERMTAIAEMQLARHGGIFRYAAEKDFFKVPWPQFVRALRLMEMRGLIRGGRFIEGVWGEQFAEPQALPLLPGIPGLALYKEISASDPIAQTRRLIERLGVLSPVSARRPA